MRHLDPRLRDDGVHRGLAELGLDRPLLRLRDPRLDLRAQLVERVVAACLDREVVVQLGQLLLLDLLHLDGERGVLAGELLGRVVVREGELDGALLAGGRSLELLLEAGDQPPGAELHHLAAALPALELRAVERADVVHDHEVALACGTLHRLERGERLADALELGLHLLVVDLRLAAADLDALVVAELRGRHDADLDREGERGALLRQVREVHLRVAHGLDAGVRERLLVPAGQPAANGLVEHRLAADLLEHHLGGTLPLRKPGTRISRPSCAAAVFSSRSSASVGTSTSTRTRESGSSVVFVFTPAGMDR